MEFSGKRKKLLVDKERKKEDVALSGDYDRS